MKTIKKASLLFASLALVLGAGLVGNSDTKEVKAEETASFDLSLLNGKGTTGTGSAMEATSGAFTISFSKGFGYSKTQVRNYANAKITISADDTVSTFSKVEMTYNSKDGGTFTPSVGSVSKANNVITWSNSETTKSVELNHTAQIRITDIKIYYEVSSSSQVEITGVSAQDVTVVKGDTVSTTLTYQPANTTQKSFTYSSVNEEVATVDENTGVIVGVNVGDTIINVVSTINTNVKTSFKVTVTAPLEPVISEVTVSSLLEKTSDDNTVVSVKGKVSNIVSTVYGNFDLVDLEDSSKSIFVYGSTKDSSKLSTKDSGKGYYTGTWSGKKDFNNACEDGDIVTMNVIFLIYNGKKEIQGVITNVEKPTESIELSDSSLVIKNGETSQLTATLTGLTGNVSWSSDNTDVADVAEDGTITAKAMGNAKITATLSGITADCDIAVIENSGEDAENALTVEEAIYVAKTTSTATAKKYFIKGIIAAYTPNSSDVSGYGNISFDISDDGTKNNTFKAFQVNYLDSDGDGKGDKFTSTDQISVGDEVVLYGAVLNYNNTTPETDGKGSAYVYSQVTVADKFVSKVNAFNFCKASAEEIKAMLDEYKALVAKNADVANKEVDETTTLGERMAYMQLIYNKKANTTGDSTSGVVITSNNSFDKTSLIALFAILGIVTISGYYIIEKKKFSK